MIAALNYPPSQIKTDFGRYRTLVGHWLISCLTFSSEGDSDSKQKTVRVQVLCTHGTEGPPEISLIQHLLFRNLSDKRTKSARLLTLMQCLSE